MKVTAVRATVLGAVADKPRQPLDLRLPCVVEIDCDEGLTGIAVTTAASAALVRSLGDDVVAGQDPRATMALWEAMGLHAAAGKTLAGASARAALDIALWDLKSRLNEEPLWRTLGGGPRARVHLSLANAEATEAAALDWLRDVARGNRIHCASVPLTGNAERDNHRVASVAELIGASRPEATLAVHFESARQANDAISVLRHLELSHDLSWVRSPTAPDDHAGALRVSREIAAAVCVGRGLARRENFLPYLRNYAANILELDPALLGVSGIVQMADAAFGFELPVIISGYPGHLGVYLFSALATAASVEVPRAQCRDGAFASAARLGDGGATAGDTAGAGLIIDRELLQAAQATERGT